MKVRISGNSIRFRLKQAEVHRFQQEKEVVEVTAFGPAHADKLSFVLKAGSSNDFSIAYQFNTVTLEVPPRVCHAWTTTELVGFEETIDTGKGEAIKILVEKDFACLDRTDVENEDTYPNPHLSC
ncbi:MAG: hypothetical protein INR73_17660 [Williamsia sp.]|nr:hypothetical protein [Williamsia sp.]